MMRRLFGLLLLTGVIITASPAMAEEQLGVYVAPKFIYGLTIMDGAKVHANLGGGSGSLRIGDKTDDTFGGALAIGYDFDKKFGVPIRAELEYAGFSEAEAKKTFHDGGDSHRLKQKFNIQTLFVNAYWDIDTGTQFTPYVGAGLGMAFIRTKLNYNGEDAASTWGASTGSKNVTNFAWNVGLGLGYDISENWTLDAGYRFVGLGSAKTKTFSESGLDIHGKTSDLYQHQFSLGVRYTF